MTSAKAYGDLGAAKDQLAGPACVQQPKQGAEGAAASGHVDSDITPTMDSQPGAPGAKTESKDAGNQQLQRHGQGKNSHRGSMPGGAQVASHLLTASVGWALMALARAVRGKQRKLKAACEELDAAKQQLAEKEAALAAATHAAATHAAAAAAASNAAAAQAAQRAQALSQTTEQVSAANVRCQQAATELEKAMGDLHVTQSELQAARSQLQAAMDELVNARARGEAAEGELGLTRSENELLKRELSRMRGQLEAASQQLARHRGRSSPGISHDDDWEDGSGTW